MKKANPADLTRRNNEARKKDIAKLLVRVRASEQNDRDLARRVKALEVEAYRRLLRRGPYDVESE